MKKLEINHLYLIAGKLSLNEAVLLTHLNNLICDSKHYLLENRWIAKTYEELARELPFLSMSTIRRTIKELEKKGYLISNNFNENPMDKTKWYAMDHNNLTDLIDS
ncbi:hypothetical protein ACQCVH_22400 [Bacillus infantis]|uniref:hypothetical protein n=1 Tax=Bacillus infantis TaxID=324767 RepID=UPI003CF3A6C1